MIVLDASVAIELLLQSADSPRIADLLFSGTETLHAPELIDLEVAQVMRRYERTGELSPARGEQALRILSLMPLQRHAHAPLIPRIWALRKNLTAYDAAYVALAEALGASLLTCDAKLAATPGHRAAIELV